MMTLQLSARHPFPSLSYNHGRGLSLSDSPAAMLLSVH